MIQICRRLSIHLSFRFHVDLTIHLSIHPPTHLIDIYLVPSVYQVNKAHALRERYRQETIETERSWMWPTKSMLPRPRGRSYREAVQRVSGALGCSPTSALARWWTLCKVPYLPVPLFTTSATKLWTRTVSLKFPLAPTLSHSKSLRSSAFSFLSS